MESYRLYIQITGVGSGGFHLEGVLSTFTQTDFTSPGLNMSPNVAPLSDHKTSKFVDHNNVTGIGQSAVRD